MREMLGMKQRRLGARRPLIEGLSGERVGKDGRIAKVIQIMDRVARRYKKHVELEDGTIIKDEEGPIEDQSLHGHKRYSARRPDYSG